VRRRVWGGEGILEPRVARGFERDALVDASPGEVHVVDDVEGADKRVAGWVAAAVDGDHHALGALRQQGGSDVQAEGHRIADMLAHSLAIDPDLGGAMHSPDYQPDALALPTAGQIELPGVPADTDGVVPHLVGGLADPLGIPAAGDAELPVEARGRLRPALSDAGVIGGEAERPLAVQRD